MTDTNTNPQAVDQAAMHSALSLLDLSNCIRLGHADRPIPAFAAFCLACLIQTIREG